MSTIMGRNGKDLIEAEEINKRWQDTQNYLKKCRNDPDNHNGMVTTMVCQAG